MICTSIQNKGYARILEILARPEIEMAEIRLDRCPLSDEEIEDLFGNSDTPLIATCRIAETDEETAWARLRTAIEAGARFADLEIEAPAAISKDFQKLCHDCGTEVIRSYHNFDGTPDDEVLLRSLARCFRYGADIAKIVCRSDSPEDSARIQALYSVVIEGVESMQGRLVAFGMGESGRQSRIECLRRGAPFSYAALDAQDATAPGQWTEAGMRDILYRGFTPFHRSGLRMPASKSFAQRAIVAAALSDGCSRLGGYSACGDSEAAIGLARALGATVIRDGDCLTITGIGAQERCLHTDCIDTGESGLLTRLAIPLLSVLNDRDFKVEGRGTLLRRPLNSAADIMAAVGVLLSNIGPSGDHSLHIPLCVKGHIVPGMAEIPGKDGSQLISGLLMALPLCPRDSVLHVSGPKSIPYMYITLDVLRRFGIQTRSEMEGDAEMLEADDWSGCTGITFRIRGGQRYRPRSFCIEGDWSAAANFLVAGAVFGSAEIEGLDMKSLQADLGIVDILVDAGAIVSQTEDGSICVRKAPLEAFTRDLGNAPDLFPIVAVLAAFCSGESRIAGVGRLAAKESDRAEAILRMLSQMGVEASAADDVLCIQGQSLSSRLLTGKLLDGGEYTSHHDHRMVMALKVASIAAKSPIVIDDEACVGKSFPGFLDLMATRP